MFTEEEEEIAGLVNEYFQQLFTTSWPNITSVERYTNLIETHVIEEINNTLTHAYKRKDV